MIWSVYLVLMSMPRFDDPNRVCFNPRCVYEDQDKCQESADKLNLMHMELTGQDPEHPKYAWICKELKRKW